MSLEAKIDDPEMLDVKLNLMMVRRRNLIGRLANNLFNNPMDIQRDLIRCITGNSSYPRKVRDQGQSS